ncbi:TPA: hypothetical protein HA241_04475 [Candidatus Woesearchaeota archaeon]|nr:hypothetical protein [Candidatus Woesearchaeota archaeon]
MTEEYSDVTLVSYNPSNHSNRPLYLKITEALGTELKELVPSVLFKESLEVICGGKTPRLFIHDGTTYKVDPILKKVRSLTPDEVLDGYIGTTRPKSSSCHPVSLYYGSNLRTDDVVKLLNNVGFDWVFWSDETPFTVENVVTIVRRLEI